MRSEVSNTVMKVEVVKSTYGLRAFHLDILFLNTGHVDSGVTVPAGADVSELFSARLECLGRDERWEIRQASPQSFAADFALLLRPGQEGRARLRFLQYKRTGTTDWCSELPPGRYRLHCVYREANALNESHRSDLVLEANPVEFAFPP